MKEMFVQFKSGRTLTVKDICDYVESQDFDVVVSRGNNKEAHVTVFHDAVEYMSVIDDDQEAVMKDPDDQDISRKNSVKYDCHSCEHFVENIAFVDPECIFCKNKSGFKSKEEN